MRRRLLNVLTALSLLLCVAVVALWYSGNIYYFGRRPQWSVTAERGTFSVLRDYERYWEADLGWVLLVGLTLPAGRALLTRFRPFVAHLIGRRRMAAGLCPSCAYDLTGNVSGVCPECGSLARTLSR